MTYSYHCDFRSLIFFHCHLKVCIHEIWGSHSGKTDGSLFRDVTLRRWVSGFWCFERSKWLHLQGTSVQRIIATIPSMTTINSLLCPVHSYPPPPRHPKISPFLKDEAPFIPVHYCKLKLSSKFPTIIFPTERKEWDSFCLTLKLRSFFLCAKEEDFEIYVRVNIILCVKKVLRLP